MCIRDRAESEAESQRMAGEKMGLWLTAPGPRCMIQVRTLERVQAVRRRAEQIVGDGIDSTELVFSDDVLHDDSTLESAGIATDAEIRLVRTEISELWESKRHHE
eukprot:TRINITY_DN40418_c0_g1_i1.p2 TRINITY_DN40418_c0_g1~~TRINITY_DN40418_c0_g1_i1.p2  ORF type:complete len:105 (+),score=27.08 TRINITY_DN40418_c0_g1_i1:67-381(+)